MNSSNTSERGDDRDEVINAWIDGLQGQDSVSGLNAAARSGALLRQVVLQASQDRAPQDAAQEQALLDRWAGMGLLRGRKQSSADWLRAVWGWLPSRGPWIGLSTLALVGGLGLSVWFSDRQPTNEQSGAESDVSISRGSEQPLQITADDPSALALRIGDVLKSNSIPVRRLDLPDGAVQLQARLPADATLARASLAPLGIAIPSHGRLNVVISRTP